VFVVVNGSSEQKEKEKAKEADDTYMIWSGELDATIGTKNSLVGCFTLFRCQ